MKCCPSLFVGPTTGCTCLLSNGDSDRDFKLSCTNFQTWDLNRCTITSHVNDTVFYIHIMGNYYNALAIMKTTMTEKSDNNIRLFFNFYIAFWIQHFPVIPLCPLHPLNKLYYRLCKVKSLIHKSTMMWRWSSLGKPGALNHSYSSVQNPGDTCQIRSV